MPCRAVRRHHDDGQEHRSRGGEHPAARPPQRLGRQGATWPRSARGPRARPARARCSTRARPGRRRQRARRPGRTAPAPRKNTPAAVAPEQDPRRRGPGEPRPCGPLHPRANRVPANRPFRPVAPSGLASSPPGPRPPGGTGLGRGGVPNTAAQSAPTWKPGGECDCIGCCTASLRSRGDRASRDGVVPRAAAGPGAADSRIYHDPAIPGTSDGIVAQSRSIRLIRDVIDPTAACMPRRAHRGHGTVLGPVPGPAVDAVEAGIALRMAQRAERRRTYSSAGRNTTRLMIPT